jgi:hypothetical protein
MPVPSPAPGPIPLPPSPMSLDAMGARLLISNGIIFEAQGSQCAYERSDERHRGDSRWLLYTRPAGLLLEFSRGPVLLNGL